MSKIFKIYYKILAKKTIIVYVWRPLKQTKKTVIFRYFKNENKNETIPKSKNQTTR